MATTPDVTVVIPVYRPTEEELLRAVDSVLTNESVAKVLLIDSTEEVSPTADLDIVKLPERVEIHTVENNGVVASRNHGLSLVETKCVIFLDQDDEYAKGAIDAMRAVISRKQQYAYGITSYPLQNETHDPGEWHPQMNVRQFGTRYGVLWYVSNKVQFWQPSGWANYPYNDWDLVLQLEKAGCKGVYVPQTTLIRYKKKGGMSSTFTSGDLKQAQAELAERWAW